MSGVGKKEKKKDKVTITLRASDMKNVAGAFKGVSDPFAVVTLLASNPNEKAKVLGMTEVIKNSLSPSWTKTFEIEYCFGTQTHINVGVYDKVTKADKDTPMGCAMFEIGEILGARGNVKAKRLKRGGVLYARAQRSAKTGAGELHLTLKGSSIKNVDGIFGKSDPFFELSKRQEGPGGFIWRPAVRSKHVNNNLNPQWEQIKVSMDILCNNNKETPIQISVYDWDKKGKHTIIGTVETSVSSMIGGGGKQDFGRGERFTIKNKKGKKAGEVLVSEISIRGGGVKPAKEPTKVDGSASGAFPSPVVSQPFLPYERPTFVDYISGGCEINLCVAIDFTGSNGDPRKPGTLHYVHRDGQLNDYEKAIMGVGSAIAKYDPDQMFPVWGFGAKYGGVVQHCFQVGSNATSHGLNGILESYRGVFKTPLTMSGPTVFIDVIRVAASQAITSQAEAAKRGQQSYTALLILTDGSVSDMNATKRAIMAAANAPLSIIVVGIGGADFGPMHQLDNFAEVTQVQSRDIVQFVEFRNYQHDKRALVQATIAELPEQVVDYYTEKGIQPLPMASPSKFNIVPDAYDEDADIDLKLSFTNGQDIAVESGGVYSDPNYRLPSGAQLPQPTAVPPQYGSLEQQFSQSVQVNAGPQPVAPFQSQQVNPQYQPAAPVAPYAQQPGATSAPYQPAGPAAPYAQQPTASAAPYQPAGPAAPYAQQPTAPAAPYQPVATAAPYGQQPGAPATPYQPAATAAPYGQQPAAPAAPYQPAAPAAPYGQQPGAPAAPYGQQPGAPAAPYQPAAPAAPYQPAAPAAPYGQQPGAPAAPYQPAAPAAPYGQQPAAPYQATAPVQPQKFRVQVPPGVTSGMQIQVQNPSTGQMMVLTVPQGVVMGQTFEVNY